MIRRKSKEMHPNARAARTETSARFAEHVDGIWCGRRDRHRLHGFRLLVALAGKFGSCRETKGGASQRAARRGRKIRRSARRQRFLVHKFLRDTGKDSTR